MEVKTTIQIIYTGKIWEAQDKWVRVDDLPNFSAIKFNANQLSKRSLETSNKYLLEVIDNLINALEGNDNLNLDNSVSQIPRDNFNIEPNPDCTRCVEDGVGSRKCSDYYIADDIPCVCDCHKVGITSDLNSNIYVNKKVK